LNRLPFLTKLDAAAKRPEARPMHESIIDRIEHLERSNRFWKTTSFVLAAILLALVTSSLTLFGLARREAVRAMEMARQQELVARAEAEAARAAAVRALQDARKKE
jgi:hypothetical protein